MISLYFLDISQNLKGLGLGLLLSSLFSLAILGVLFTAIFDNYFDEQQNKMLWALTKYGLSTTIIMLLLGVTLLTATPSKEVAQELMEEIRKEKLNDSN